MSNTGYKQIIMHRLLKTQTSRLTAYLAALQEQIPCKLATKNAI